jgi:zinc transporter, ZIP family
MLEAAFWGFVGGAALILGAAIGLLAKPSQRVIGWVMAFGGGVLISAVSFELIAEGFRVSGRDTLALGIAAGALTFFGADWVIDRRGGDQRKSSGGEQAGGTAMGIVLGALLDGIPESIAIGVSLIGGQGVGVAVVAAVFISNVPESLSAATGLRTAGRSPGWIMGLWAGTAVLTALAAAFGYGVLGDASEEWIGFVDAFAAGAIVVMLVDTMLPEAHKFAGRVAGLLTVLGFAVSALLSSL